MKLEENYLRIEIMFIWLPQILSSNLMSSVSSPKKLLPTPGPGEVVLSLSVTSSLCLSLPHTFLYVSVSPTGLYTGHHSTPNTVPCTR